MKNLLLATALLSGFISSCDGENKTEAQQKIEAFVKENSNDPDNYESVSFGEPSRVRMNEVPGNSDTITVAIRLTHTYRTKNKYGAKVRVTREFMIAQVNGSVIAGRYIGKPVD